ncbi:MAG TPA: UvrD-helicase domain-containing protein [Nitrospirota bacterium]|nr:UvrD-helicase domain-containing protein [Nitrospirota bacterium]
MDPRETRIFDGLNEAQKAAVTTTAGPVLVVAGPGTGKTLTMVRRIAYLVQQGVPPESILAVTFTNRAAREMKERTAALLGQSAGAVLIGTFHVLGLLIIQDNRPDDFSICDRDEQIELLKPLVGGSARRARQAAGCISRIKNYLEPDNPPSSSVSEGGRDGVDDDQRELYDAYQAALRERNAFDFDDLILTPLEILADNRIAQSYRDRYGFLIVDEYQDINPAQYRLLRLITNARHNICAVGDPDQAIYAFRGADIGNFLNFERDFPDTVRITLSENFRSTGTILQASNALIRNNVKRIDKTLFTAREQGSKVVVVDAPDERAEGEFIIREIEVRMGGTSHFQMRQNTSARDYTGSSFRFSDFAVIYRTNAQAKALEEVFSASGIPYQVLGGRSGTKIAEIEETIAYLHLVIHAGEAGGPREASRREAKLLSPADFFDPRADTVVLMTMHMAKGLEFPVVFLTGVDEGLLPCTIIREDVDREEERRLFYVGMTRAKNDLFLIHARSRFLYGQRLAPIPSPYLGAFPESLVHKTVIADRTRKQKEKDRQMGLF